MGIERYLTLCMEGLVNDFWKSAKDNWENWTLLMLLVRTKSLFFTFLGWVKIVDTSKY